MRRLIVPVTLALALAVTGCGSDPGNNGIATAGGPANPSASGSEDKLSDSEKAVKFAQCMREHGVDVPDPDPDSGGRGAVTFRGGAADHAKFEKAMKECQKYAPFGGEPPKLDAAQVEKLRQFARCMRENGVPDFPDPSTDGMIKIGPRPGGGPDDTKFKAAEEKCRQYLPPPPSGAPGAAGGPKVESR
jgi:hypothetical protein